MSKDYQFKSPDTLGKWDLLMKLSEAVDQGDAATPSEIINILLIVLNDEQLEKVQTDLVTFNLDSITPSCTSVRGSYYL